MIVLSNLVNDLPHIDGHAVLHIRAQDYDIEIIREGERYCVYVIEISSSGEPGAIRIKRPEPTIEQAVEYSRLWVREHRENLS